VDDLPPEVIRLITSKLDDIRTLKEGIDKSLFMSSIRVEGQAVTLNADDKSTFNTWFVVQLWRDWFTHQNTQVINGEKYSGARMYRAMLKGGDEYLPLPSVVEKLKAFRRKDLDKLDKQEVEEDLKLMKDFAKHQVHLLCVSRSMLSVDEADMGYFTCTKVENDELPWAKKIEY
jgi:hypothetical protein